MTVAVSEDAMTSEGARAPAPTCPHCDDTRLSSTGSCTSCGRPSAVCGGFRVGRELARGGVGRIHVATHADGREAVVKVLDRSALNPWQVHQLFSRSARIVGAFRHPAFPRILGFESAPGGRSFVAMERMRGGTLAERVRAGARLEGRALEALLRDLLEGLAYLHTRALVHGDVTPSNVMFRSEADAQPVLVDLDSLSCEGEHGTASLVVTPGYTAPEQRAGEVTAAGDLYGAGATIVYAATGKSPDAHDRVGDGLALDLRIAGVSRATHELVRRLVDLDPKRRPRSARAALRALNGRGAASRARRVTLAIAAAVVVLVSLSFALGTLHAHPLP